jgi:FlaA1/EpsC-like NDP-sugar epimerase
MEGNPCEAVRNNVTGTRIVAESADRHGVDRFILISTDKAVNPVSIMGASKAVGELLLQEASRSSRTIFASVRFGNVLGSNGSAIPLFLDQIRSGGPVTITDPGMRRYFMLTGEAVQLVLHAARLAQGGELFVLDMGEQISVVDMARNLIRLAGFVPDRDIALTYLGRRSGEKLVEELIGRHERVEATAVHKVLCVRSERASDRTLLPALLSQLEQAAAEGQVSNLLKTLCLLVPSYQPSDALTLRAQESCGSHQPAEGSLLSPVDPVSAGGP